MQRKTPQTSDIDDETLFAKVERGDVEAFTAVYNKYHKLLYALAYRYLMSSAMAEDAVQHVFTRFWEFRSELRVGISLRNYLITMTKYLQWLRRCIHRHHRNPSGRFSGKFPVG